MKIHNLKDIRAILRTCILTTLLKCALISAGVSGCLLLWGIRELLYIQRNYRTKRSPVFWHFIETISPTLRHINPIFKNSLLFRLQGDTHALLLKV